MPVAISVENLSKRYLITHQKKERYTALRDVIAARADSLRRKLLRPFLGTHIVTEDNPASEEFWALKDLNFNIEQGDRVGIIGRNGAGKSTVLKILSRITEPTTGRIHISGRVASLLEVGTGFHPELTGRENIFLNGAILGMSNAEIKHKFDEIVAFAEIERFLDTPVKRYSSGMHVRLAFAVAAHLEPDILIVDEVLAVGDGQFQKKCIGKLEEVSTEGRTVLFVSHNMESVTRLCAKGMLLDAGHLVASGSINEVVRRYLQSDSSSRAFRRWAVGKRPGNEIVEISEVCVHDATSTVQDNCDIAAKVGITVKYDVLSPSHLLSPAFNFHNDSGVNLFDSHDTTLAWRRSPKDIGSYASTVWIPPNFLAEGMVVVGVAIVTPDPFRVHVHEREVVAFNVFDSHHSISARGDYVGPFPGLVRPLLEWDLVASATIHQ